MLSLGTVLADRYRVDRMLEIGPLEGQYRGWDLVAGAAVLIREMSAQPDLDIEMLQTLQHRFGETATALMELDHPHIVPVVGHFCSTGDENGQHLPDTSTIAAYLVLGAVPGQTLAELIEREGTLKERRVANWTRQLLEALEHAHQHGILHRDIKPDNIIITPDDRALLTNFEVIALWNPSDPRTWTAKRVMGVPDYAPPERWEMKTSQIDARSDLYSLGATLYHALTGERPLTAGERTSNPYRFLQVKALTSRVGTQLRAVILKAMELPPDRRYASAAEMLRAVEMKAQPDAYRDPEPAPFLPKQQQALWPRFAGWAASTIVIIVAALLGFWLNQNLDFARIGVNLPFRAQAEDAVEATDPVIMVLTTPVTAATVPGRDTEAGTPLPTDVEAQPTPTATVAPLPTMALVDAAPGPPDGWQLALRDDFDDNTNQWIVSDFEDDWGSVSRRVTDAVYRWEINAAQAVSRWCTPDPEEGQDSAADFYLAVDAQRVRGPQSAAYGLVLRHTAGSYYLFSVRDDGYYQFSLWAGFGWEPIIDWTQTTSVVAGEVNRLGVLGDGSTFDLYINNTTVATAEDDQLAAGEMGLSISTAATDGLAVFIFDNFELWVPAE